LGRYTIIESFNPRPREAGDTKHHSLRRQESGFNPRPREAGDSVSGADGLLQMLFQSTPA